MILDVLAGQWKIAGNMQEKDIQLEIVQHSTFGNRLTSRNGVGMTSRTSPLPMFHASTARSEDSNGFCLCAGQEDYIKVDNVPTHHRM